MSRNFAPIAKWGTDKKYKKVEDFLLRPAVEDQAMKAAATILADVKERGDKAVIECARRFDGSSISTRRLRVSPAEIAEAELLVDDDQDCIWLRVDVTGGASCHVGYRSCFYRRVPVGSAYASQQSDGHVDLEWTDREKVFDPRDVYGDAPNPTKL